MSRIDRVAGLIRSLAIYHGIPLRQRRLRRFYSQFVSAGDLVFDVGAHVGNRSRALASLGCRVIAVEPQPDFARMLRIFFAGSARIEVIEAAVSDAPGRVSLAISDRFPTVTTMAAPWQEARGREPGFSGVTWNRRVDVETTTLDVLVARFGIPSFIKIDVEGTEPAVLAGLSHPVRALSFEYLPSALDHVQRCTARLGALAPYRYNWSLGETSRLWSKEWMDDRTLLAVLAGEEAQRRPGDVYARLDASGGTG